MITHTITSQTSDASIAALIQRLPDELHPYIFREIGDPIVVSHVCRAWRRLALADPYLWSTTNIFVDHLRAGLPTRYPHMNMGVLELYLSRSRPAPICVEIQICFLQESWLGKGEEECNCISGLEMIMDHLCHIKKLQIHWEPNATNEIVSILHDGFSKHQVPMLESFELSTYDGSLYDTDMLYYPENAPALRQVCLSDVEVPWDSSMFRNLTELFICLDYGTVANVDELFNTLRACPDLTTLFFQFKNVAESSSQITTHAKSINLPYLTDIILRDLPTSLLQVIVRSINVSQHANWNIEIDFPAENMVSTMCGILRAIAAHMVVSQTRDLILALGENCLTFLSSQISETDSGMEKPRDDVFVVSFKLQDNHLGHAQSEYPFFSRAAQFISALNANNNTVRFTIRFLRSWAFGGKSGSVLYESYIWTKPLLLVLPNLECLLFKPFFTQQKTDGKIDDNFYYYKMGFMEGMVSNLVQNSSRGLLGGLLCPKLRSVEIAHGYGSLSGQLIQLLSTRFKIGIPIRSLKMTWSDQKLGGIPLDDKWLKKAEEYAERVSVCTQADYDYDWHRPFRPKFEYTGDHYCNGALLGHFWNNW